MYIFIGLVFLTALIQGYFSYALFSKRYEEKLEQLDAKSLESIKKEIEENIINKAHDAYINITFNPDIAHDVKSFFASNDEHINLKMYVLQGKLKNIAAIYGDAIDSIELYNHDKNIIISSISGVILLDDNKDRASVNMHRYEKIKSIRENTYWLPTQRGGSPAYYIGDNFHYDLMSYKVNYPIGAAVPNNKGYLIINVNVDAIISMFQKVIFSSDERVFLIDEENNLLAHNEHNTLDAYLKNESSIWELEKYLEETGRIIEQDNTRYFTSILSFNNGWTLVKMTPLSRFYADFDIIRRTLFLISVITILLGLTLSHVFTLRIYSPLKALVENVQILFGVGLRQEEKDRNEYEIINNVINHLSVKVSYLEEVLEKNVSLLKNNIIYDLFNDNYANKEDFDASLSLAGVSMTQDNYYCMLIELDKKIMNNLTMENIQFIKLDIIQKVEEVFTDSRRRSIATTLDKYTIGAVINSSSLDKPALMRTVNNIYDYIIDNYTIPIAFAISPPITNSYHFSSCFGQTRNFLRYYYYMTDTRLFSLENAGAREKCLETIPYSDIEAFYDSLLSNNITEIELSLRQLTKAMSHGNYPYLHCQQRQMDIMNCISRYSRTYGIKTRDLFEDDILIMFQSIYTIKDFHEFVLKIAESIIKYVEKLNENRPIILVENTKNFIEENLSEPLSLEQLASQLSVSSGYLSRIFKKETSMNFVDYVNQRRLTKAKELLLTTDLSVRNISLKVGFNNTNYFIKRFKQAYGDSPQSFRVNQRVIDMKKD